MNNKRIRYLLFSLLAVIWGLVVYRILNGIRHNNRPISFATSQVKLDYGLVEDSFSIFANYSDPFIRNNASDTESLEIPRRVEYQKENNLNESVQVLKSSFDPRSITYFGMIANPQNKKKVAIMNIGGNEVLVAESDEINDCILKKIEKNRVRIQYRGVDYYIPRRN